MKLTDALLAGCVALGLSAGCGSQGEPWAERSSTPPSPGPPAVAAPTPRPVAPEVKAGWADDNAQYNYYLGYLDRFAHLKVSKLDVSGRVVFTVVDSQGRSLPNCDLLVRTPEGKVLCRRRTYADGRAMFFPYEDSRQCPPRLAVQVRRGQEEVTREFDLSGPAAVELRFATAREQFRRVPVDVAFLIDTTGSMADEIEKLKQTLAAIHYQVTQMRPTPDARFGMVLYRDRKDEYVTRVTPFTADINEFARQLKAVSAGGGGDAPEDIQQALRAAAEELKWRPEAVKLAFLLGDAPPHLDYGDEKFTYRHWMRHAAAGGIKTTTIGASGLDETGEYVFRQLAQYTMGLFVFLTYGEKGESGPASPWTVSHHTGENWEARNLDAIIVQSIARELAHLSEVPLAVPEDYFQARPGQGVRDAAVLEDLFAECARQLVDFSQAKIEPGTTAAVVPVACGAGCQRALGESLGNYLDAALARQKSFKLLERADLKAVMDELDLNLASAFDAKLAPAPGKQLPARMLVLSKVTRTPDRLDMFVKLVRVETGEVLSASMLRIDPQLVESESN